MGAMDPAPGAIGRSAGPDSAATDAEASGPGGGRFS